MTHEVGMAVATQILDEANRAREEKREPHIITLTAAEVEALAVVWATFGRHDGPIVVAGVRIQVLG